MKTKVWQKSLASGKVSGETHCIYTRYLSILAIGVFCPDFMLGLFFYL